MMLTLQCFIDAMNDVDCSDADGEVYHVLEWVLEQANFVLVQIELSDCCLD
jgi:hypothetical protein